MSGLAFSGVGKVYADGTRAVDDLSFTVDDGEFMVLVGPSGCGKTTALRMVAGLEEITEGEIQIGDRVVNRVEPRKRDIAMVFQNYALYPHMSVFDNIAFPLRSRNLAKREIGERVERIAGALGLGELLKRKPRTLSGGQRQRVAMGRAIVREPKLFLMDEPLSNLDAKLRVQMRAEISKLQKELGVTTLYVTHDQVEAMTMGTRIAIMRKGVLQQIGSPQSVYEKPANLFVATFVGSPAMNLFRTGIERLDGRLSCRIGDQQLSLHTAALTQQPKLASYVGRELAVGIRPEDIYGSEHLNNGWPILRGEVRLVESLGPERFLHLEVAGNPVVTDAILEIASDIDASTLQALEREAQDHKVPIVARLPSSAGVETAVGRTSEVAVNVDNLHFFDLDSGAAIR
jgi:multiple sugar transport system ATP-binding protein